MSEQILSDVILEARSGVYGVVEALGELCSLLDRCADAFDNNNYARGFELREDAMRSHQKLCRRLDQIKHDINEHSLLWPDPKAKEVLG